MENFFEIIKFESLYLKSFESIDYFKAEFANHIDQVKKRIFEKMNLFCLRVAPL